MWIINFLLNPKDVQYWTDIFLSDWVQFFSVFREKERIKIFFFSQNVPKISVQEGTANGSEDLSLYLIHVHFVLFPVMCIFAIDYIFIFIHFEYKNCQSWKSCSLQKMRLTLTLLKCSFNLENAIDTLVNRSVGEYQYMRSFHIPQIAKVGVKDILALKG